MMQLAAERPELREEASRLIEPGVGVGPLRLGDTRARALEVFPSGEHPAGHMDAGRAKFHQFRPIPLSPPVLLIIYNLQAGDTYTDTRVRKGLRAAQLHKDSLPGMWFVMEAIDILGCGFRSSSEKKNRRSANPPARPET